MRKKIILLSGLICLSVMVGLIIQSYRVQTASPEYPPPQAGFFTHVEGDSKIYIMTIVPVVATWISIDFLDPDGNVVYSIYFEDVDPFTRTDIEVSDFTGNKKFDGMVLIGSDQPFVATLQLQNKVQGETEIWEIQILSVKYQDILPSPP